MNDFNIKKFLTENKMTRNSRLLSERSQIQTNKPLRNLVIQYIKKELPDGKDIEGLFTHEDVAKEYIKKYVTEEEPNYKSVADSDEEMNEWYKTLSYQIQGRESELNEEEQMNDFNIKKFLTENKLTRNSRLLNEDYLTEFKTTNVDGVTYEVEWEIIGNPKDGESGTAIGTGAKYSDDEGKFYKASIRIDFHTIFDSVEEISKDEYDTYKKHQPLNEEFDAFTREELDALQQYEDTGMFPEWLSDEEGDALVARWRAEYEDDFIDPAGGSGLDSHV